ncbi:alpha/beta-hydrolase [Lindgomyces ingoldianus]|uniref:Alpha/beta-hydrolase n=1 Tax=Lindgomyces ingoldianus TaxID=673940 RepID=A0ACB6R018_9PLEO|nr:alpha/beta-hydrolase [Lindgomyces ingoldianus]KAF2471665.1 alpha/beta-hydrolase [Lindgomyces ingoldianus]
MASSTPSKTSAYPQPITILPKQTHKSTMIILHGRGSTASKFASPFLSHPVTPLPNTPFPSPSQPFQSHFPHTKFIFPTASLRRAVVYKRSLTHQWFDMWEIATHSPEYREGLSVLGLRESAGYLQGLLEEAVREVGGGNVVLVGLSQGCAVGLVTLMLWDREAKAERRTEGIAGFAGMCGWLPFRKGMLQALDDDEEGKEDTGDDFLFERSEDEGKEKKSNLERVVEWLREELEMNAPVSRYGEEITVKNIPVFMGHGTEDEKVQCDLGKKATEFLKKVGVNVSWKQYSELGHWYSADMLRDLVEFVKGLDGWNHGQEITARG